MHEGIEGVRAPAVAGSFYPASPTRLRDEVRHHLAAAEIASLPRPKALIVPHAGYVYSGPIAGAGYATLVGRASDVTRVVLLGPSHRAALRGIATSSADAFATPLGEVPLDRAAIDGLLLLPGVACFDAAHELEHSLEVQLPFLQCVLGDFALVPLSVGDARDDEVAAVLEALWGGDETLIVVSSDLSHYYDYETAKALDARTTRAIEMLRPDALGSESACGRIPTRGLLLAAKQRGLTPHTLDVRSSGDTAGPRDEVVGYGAWAFS